ncbi:DEAD/DEAH box helicase [Streptomyces samsunensis]|uniref:DEAD/DEAH box helicase n=1 Tax=Streptomyces malaysiensis TaxID=92644 RepID=UPI001581A8D9|nr:DEAD/DEAH box helicase [Streptomyces samsunensis]NUH39331.1 DEAD/DEAH box helicase [Streptomyces samsunensis]
MLPSLAAEDLRRALAAYLTTSFALADDDVREELEAFLERPESRLFRGPYLRVRTPFRYAPRGWEKVLDWSPDLRPYTHQATAWERLSSKSGHAPEPTIVTTGTGSGKTESFLVPILDHCARARAAGVKGVKALLLYPMNALADDQARRIDDFLAKNAALSSVTAGIYIGGASGNRPPDDEDENAPGSYARESGASTITPAQLSPNSRLITDREAIRANPPDLLLTNYKMLDLLLQRIPDVPLWQDGGLTYVVLDEFHTYDGAQGTDVAMLLRRLGAATGKAEPGRPLGTITPVATSATLGGGTGGTGATYGTGAVGRTAATSNTPSAEAAPTPDGPQKSDRELLLEFAEKVFGTPFPDAALIGEDRQTPGDFVAEPDFLLPVPSPAALAAVPDPLDDPSALHRLAELVVGRDFADPIQLGEKLRQHNLIRALLDVAGDTPVTVPEIAREFAKRGGGAAWDEAARTDIDLVATGLARLLALVSTARAYDPIADRTIPFLRVEAQLWVREVRRVIRAATPTPHFRWFDDDGPTGDTRPNPANLAVYPSAEVDSTADADTDPDAPGDGASALTPDSPVPFVRPVGPAYRAHLPAVYCRHCGRSGWAALSTDLEWQQLKTKPLEIYRASAQGNRAVRWMIRARPGEHTPVFLHAEEAELRTVPSNDTVPVITVAGPVPANAGDKCPSCDLTDGMRFLGAGTATLASVTTTQLFSDRGLTDDERKLLVFTDSVQDATHRAAFIANRSFGFTFRGLLAEQLKPGAPVAVHDLATDAAEAVVTAAEKGEMSKLASIVPPDLRDNPEIRTLLSGDGFSDAGAYMLQDRMVFQTLLEFGLRSRLGRTLELTRTAAAEVHLPDAAAVAALLREAHQRLPGQITLPTDDADYIVYLRGLLERMRLRGALFHPWLKEYIAQAGARRWPIWGGRPTGMPAFPRGLAAPTFPVLGHLGTSEFDSLARDNTWFADWGHRTLGCERREARALTEQAMKLLAQREVLATYPAEGGSTVFALRPRTIMVHSLATGPSSPDDGSGADGAGADGTGVNDHGVRCDSCTWRQTVPPGRREDWLGTPCLRFQCGGTFTADDRDYSDDYYRRLYTVDRPGDVLTAEHTGALSRARREEVEQAFKNRPSPFDPNVLTCTPTLELGIDIGNLSAVLLASLPPAPANYAQRIGRAGRSTGNSLTVTFVPRRARNQYYLHAPEQMLAGRIIPPDCYLDASEILRRQYLAYLLDRAADRSLWRGTMMPEEPMPHRIGVLFTRGLAEDGWFRRFLDVAHARHAELASSFVQLFPGMSAEAEQGLRQFAQLELEQTVGQAATAWRKRLEALRSRSRQIGRAFDALSTASGDRERDEQRRQLYAERRSVNRRRDALVGENSVNAMVRLGLLPNYTLHDDATLLDATLWWKDADGEFQDQLTEYGRGSRMGLLELAPGNTFHTDGYKYTVNGLDLGAGEGDTAYAKWRLCPECGYVATAESGLDLTACPRCLTPQIADPGALHTVLVPERVTARERREDARLTDERDERERRRFNDITLVDIDPEQPQGLRAWKRVGELPFGVEFARVATIRTLNLGPAAAAGPEHQIAGDDVQVPGFETCLECGAVRGVHPQAWDRSAQRIGTRHAYWCGHKDDGIDAEAASMQRLVLAHELTTQALRILLPVSTMELQTRLVSFKAALLLGITKHFGGAPDHLRVVPATMPGGTRELRRRFLVLHDSMPGGTGYLEHLADATVLHRVLALAQTALRDCPCGKENLRTPCHRCLLPHVSSNEHPFASLRVARELLDEILTGWDTEQVDTLSGVRIDQLAESELEKQFVRTLVDWGSRRPESGSVTPRAGERGMEYELRFTRPDGSGTRWLFQDHVRQLTSAPSEPDYLLTRIDGPSTRIAVFLDGYAFHASTGINRIADDAAKREALRAEGMQVWQFTHADVMAWKAAVEGTADDREVRTPAEPLLGEGALRTARQIHQMLTGGPRPDDTLDPALRNPIETLLAVLADPDAEKWSRRTAALISGFAGGGAARQPIDRRLVGERLPDVLAGGPLPVAGNPAAADAIAMDVRTLGGLRVIGLLDRRAEPATGQPGMSAWSAFTVLDDRDEAVAEPGHRARWADWLRWSNLLQLLTGDRGSALPRSFHQVAMSMAGQLDPHTVALLTGALPTTTGLPDELPEPWAEAVEWASSQAEELLFALCREARTRHFGAPEVGFELDDRVAQQAELAWRDARVAVFLDVDEHRDAAFAEAGWHVVHARTVDVAELAERLENV